MKALQKKFIIPLGALVLTLSIAGVAYAATSTSPTVTLPGSTITTTAGSASAAGSTDVAGPFGRGLGGQRSDETALTGDVLEKVKAAALAQIGSTATIQRAETDADGHAKYEVHAIKADGTRVVVYVNESYAVVSVETCAGPDGDDMGRGHMGGMGNGEAALTGDTLAKVQAAALAAGGAGSTLLHACTETDNSNTAVKYEALVKKSDGTIVRMYLDASFKVLSTDTAPMGDGHRDGDGDGYGRGFGRGGRMGGMSPGGTAAGGASTTAAPATFAGSI